MKIAVLGPGALGCLLAALFFEAGEEVVLVDYRPERVALVRRQGIRLQTPEGDLRVIPVPIGMSPEAGPRDLTIVAVKAPRTRAAALELKPLMAAGGLALTLQNGLGNLEELAREAGWERLLAGVGLLGANQRAVGEVVYAGRGVIYVGLPAGSRVPAAELAAVAQLFRRAGLECQVRDDIEAALWEKLILNVAINPLTALLRVPNGALLDLPAAWELAVAAAQEAEQVAQAAGVRVTGAAAERLRQVCTGTAANRSSMLQDVLAGRDTEIEALNAQVVSRGAAFGVPTPVNYALTQLLRALGQSYPLQVG